MSSGALPATLGRYQPVAVLGEGAMGVVYRALDPLIDRVVAIKVIRAALLAPEARAEFLERFRREARAAARCSHPAIIAVFDFADDAEAPFLVMEFVEGRTFSALLREAAANRAQAIPGLMSTLLLALDGLAAAHAQGVVHRDIKPANILVTPQGRPKIADFGIARMEVHGLTEVGGMIGTPGYMAPEQALGRPVGAAADVFAAGAIAYEVLFGRAPFTGATLAELVLKLTGPEPAALGRLAQTPLGRVLSRALAKDPAERFPHAGAFAAALREAMGRAGAPVAAPAAPSAAPPPPEPPPLAPPPPAPARPSLDLTATQREAAIRALAFLIGPIARVHVQRAAAEASDPEAFIETLTGAAPTAPEAAKLRAELRKLF
jgi:serine/threonine-protein kinase